MTRSPQDGTVLAVQADVRGRRPKRPPNITDEDVHFRKKTILYWQDLVLSSTWLLKMFKIRKNAFSRMHKLKRILITFEKMKFYSNFLNFLPKYNFRRKMKNFHFRNKIENSAKNSKKLNERLFLRFIRFLAFSFRGLRELGLTWVKIIF